MSKSKSKGYRGESEVAEMLSSWSRREFRRVPSSGALRWSGTQYWTWGDIVPPEDFFFVIETKNHRVFDLDEVLRKTPGNAKLTYFWYEQTVESAARASAALCRRVRPMMFYKQTRLPWMVVLDMEVFNALLQHPGFVVAYFEVPCKYPIAVCAASSFLGAVSYDRMAECSQVQ